MPLLKIVAACLALSVSSLHILDARRAVATDPVSRLTRIEQRLLPAVQVTNAPPVKYLLTERMAHHAVPALSWTSLPALSVYRSVFVTTTAQRSRRLNESTNVRMDMGRRALSSRPV
jgi:hypothetical protein